MGDRQRLNGWLRIDYGLSPLISRQAASAENQSLHLPQVPPNSP